MARLTTQQRLELELGLRRDVDGDASPADVSPPPSLLSPINGNAVMTSNVGGAKKAAPPPTAPKPASRSPGVSPGVSPSQFRKADVGIQGYRPVSFNPSNVASSAATPSSTPFNPATSSSSSSSAAATASPFTSTSVSAAAAATLVDADLPLPPPPADLAAPPLSDDFPPPPNNDELFPPPPPPIAAEHSSIPSPAVNPPYLNANTKNYNNGVNNNNNNSNNNNNNTSNMNNNHTPLNKHAPINNNSINNSNNSKNNNSNSEAVKTGSNSKLRQYQPPTFHGKLQDKDDKSIPLASILTKSLRNNEQPETSGHQQATTPTHSQSAGKQQSTPTHSQSAGKQQSTSNHQPKGTTTTTQLPSATTASGTTTTSTTAPAAMANQENNVRTPFNKPYNNNIGNISESVPNNNVNNVSPYKTNNSVNNNNHNNNINANNSKSSPSIHVSRPAQSNHSSNEYSPSPVATDKQRRNPSSSSDSAFGLNRNSSEIGGAFPSGSSGAANAASGTANAASGASAEAPGQNPVLRSVKPPISPASSQRSSGSNPSDFTHEAEVDKLTDQLLKGLRATKDPNFFGMCAKCGGEVLGESTGCQAMDNIFHVKCFTCSVCSSQLKGKPFYAMEGKPFCEDCYLNTLEKCSVCSKPITDRILRATGKPYHPACFICVVCGKSLDGIPFTVDATNQIHCIEDFHNKFAPKCHVCGLGIVPEPGETETVRIVALDRSFHVHCYKCEDCGLLLGTVNGEQRPNYPLDDHILCQQCNATRIRQLTSPPVTDL